jgi:hypothetical protein
MHARHVAYGLQLHASFAIPGMPSASAGELPRLALELIAPAQLADAWSGPDGSPAWSGRLGDGHELRIERGAAGDILFTYGRRARFRLDPTRQRLVCAPAVMGLHWQQVLVGRVLPNVALMRGYEALHASAIDSPGGVVAIAAPSGAGKTTLALELLRRGWRLFADDVLTLGASTEPGHVCGYPGTPHMNVAGELPLDLDPEEIGPTLGTLAGERWIAARAHASEARPVRMVCLLERGPGLPLALRALPPNPLPLAPYMIGLADDSAREGARFARYADLMGDATLVRLTAAEDSAPGELADLIEQALADRPTLAGVGR